MWCTSQVIARNMKFYFLEVHARWCYTWPDDTLSCVLTVLKDVGTSGHQFPRDKGEHATIIMQTPSAHFLYSNCLASNLTLLLE